MLGAGLFQRLIDSGKHLSSSLLETIIPGHKLKIDKNSQPQTMLDTESKHTAETTHPVDGDTVEEEDDLSIQTIPYEINRYECECSECENCDQDCTDEDVTDFLALHRLEIERLSQDACSPKCGTTVDIEVKDRVFMEQVNFGQRKDDEQDGKHHSEIQSLTRIRQQSNSQSIISKKIVMHSSEQDTTKLKAPLCEFSERIVGRIDNMSENKQQSEHEILSQSQPDSNASLNITNAGLDVNKCIEEETPIKPKRLLYLEENSGILPSSAQAKFQSQSTFQQPLISSDAIVSKKQNSINAAMPILYSSDDEEVEWVHVDTTKKFEDKKEGVPTATCSDQGTSSKAMHSKIEQTMNLNEEIQLRKISSVMNEGSNRDAIIGTKCTAPSPSKGNCSTPSALSRVQSESIEHNVNTAKSKTWINTDLSMLESSDDEEVSPRGNCVPAQDSKKVVFNHITNAKDPKDPQSKNEQTINLKEEIQMQKIFSATDKGSNRDAIIGTKCTAPSPSKGNCSTPSALSRVQSESIEHNVNTAKSKTWINTDLSMLESSDDEEVPPRGNCVPAQDSKKVVFNRSTITKNEKDPRASKGKGPDAKLQTSSKGKRPASTDRTLNEAKLSHPNKSSNCAETDVICLDDSDSDSTIDLLESSSSDEIIICNESNLKTSSSIQKQGRDRKRKQSLTTSSNVEVFTLFDTDDGHEASSWTASQRKRARKRAQRHSSGSRQTPSRDNGQVIVID